MFRESSGIIGFFLLAILSFPVSTGIIAPRGIRRKDFPEAAGLPAFCTQIRLHFPRFSVILMVRNHRGNHRGSIGGLL
jgi:hypothetical protein